MESGGARRVKTSAKDTGLGIALLGSGLLVSVTSYLSYLGVLLSIIGIIILLYKRHYFSVRQGRSLYASIILYVLTVVGTVVAIIIVGLSLAATLFSEGYTGGTIPASIFHTFLIQFMAISVALIVLQTVCYLLVSYPFGGQGMKVPLILTAVIYVALKISGVFFEFYSISSTTFNPLSIGFLEDYTTQFPLLLLNIASDAAFGLCIIYVGILLYTGRIATLPDDESYSF